MREVGDGFRWIAGKSDVGAGQSGSGTKHRVGQNWSVLHCGKPLCGMKSRNTTYHFPNMRTASPRVGLQTSKWISVAHNPSTARPQREWNLQCRYRREDSIKSDPK